MATGYPLINCTIHAVENDTGVYSQGESDLPTAVFHIKADQGYTVSASDFEDKTSPFDYPQLVLPCSIYDDPEGVAGTVNNKVIVEVDIKDSFTINQDTNIVIDITGKAREIQSKKELKLFIREDIYNQGADNQVYGQYNITDPTGVTVTVTPSAGVTHSIVQNILPINAEYNADVNLGSNEGFGNYDTNDKYHIFTISDAEESEEHAEIAKFRFEATSSDSNFLAYFTGAGVYSFFDFLGTTTLPIIDENKFVVKIIEEDYGTLDDGSQVLTSRTFSVSYREPSLALYDVNSFSGTTSSDFKFDQHRIISFRSEKVVARHKRPTTVEYEIEQVDALVDNVGVLGNWPTAGIKEGDGKIIVKGDVGATFKIKLVDLGESSVTTTVEGSDVTQGNPVDTSEEEYFGGSERILR